MKIDQYCQRQRCKHVEFEQFFACFRVARVCQRQLGFLVILRFSYENNFDWNKLDGLICSTRCLLTLWRPQLPSECPDVKKFKWRLINPVWHRIRYIARWVYPYGNSCRHQSVNHNITAVVGRQLGLHITVNITRCHGALEPTYCTKIASSSSSLRRCCWFIPWSGSA